jgi:hypothetical protein
MGPRWLTTGKIKGPDEGAWQVVSKYRLVRSIEEQHHQTPYKHSEDHARYREC